MITDELLDYIKEKNTEGLDKEQIREVLISVGWDNGDVQEAFDVIGGNLVQKTTLADSSQRNIDTLKTQPFSEEPTLDKVKKTDPDNTSKEDDYRARHSNINKSGNGALYLIVLLILLVLSAMGAYAYNKFIKRPTPYQVMVNMLDTDSLSITSKKFSNDINVDLSTKDYKTDEKIAATKISVNSSGASDILDKENINYELTSKVDFSGSYSLYSVDFKVDWSVLFKDKILYVKLSDISEVPVFDFSKIKDKWISVADLTDGVDGVKEQIGYDELNSIGFDIENIEENKEIYEEINTKFAEFMQSEEMKDMINRSFTDNGNKKINGVDTYHYSIRFDKDDLKMILYKIVDIVNETTGITGDYTNDSSVMKDEFNSKELDPLFDILASANIETWIEQKDFLPRKTLIDMQFRDTIFLDTLGILDFQREISVDGGITIIYSSSNHNESVDIQIPTDPITLEEVARTIYGADDSSDDVSIL